MPRLLVGMIAAVLSWAWAAEPATKDEVRALLDAAASAPNRDTQQSSFQRIEDLGCAAVPELAQHVDDRRPLPYASISLRNDSPEAFEGIRHYAPKVVGEAVAALLNQLTGEHFAAVYNGATAQELTDAANRWKEYVRTTAAGKLCPPRDQRSNKPLQPTRATGHGAIRATGGRALRPARLSAGVSRARCE